MCSVFVLPSHLHAVWFSAYCTVCTWFFWMHCDFVWVCVSLETHTWTPVELRNKAVPQSWHFEDIRFSPDSNSLHDTTSITNCYHNHSGHESRMSWQWLTFTWRPLSAACGSSPSGYTVISQGVWREKGSWGGGWWLYRLLLLCQVYMPNACFLVYVHTSAASVLCVCVACFLFNILAIFKISPRESRTRPRYTRWSCLCFWAHVA